MKTKILYVVVSSESDVYLEQAYISMLSLRHYMDDANIVLLTDKSTSDTFKGVRKKEVDLFDEVVVEDLDAERWPARHRSRLLKTNMRNLVEGDFLYIDSDTIISRPLYDIESIDCDLGACRDAHCNFENHPAKKLCMEKLSKFGLPSDISYFNSGVMYVKETPKNHAFFDIWNKYLQEGFELGIIEDQAPLAKADMEMGNMITLMSDEWNCQILRGIRYLKNAYIVHYLCTIPSQYQNRQLFILNELSAFEEVKKTGELSEVIKETICDPFKGLAESTHTLSGEDVKFINSPYYHFVRLHYKNGDKSFVLRLLRIANYVERLIKRYIRILQGRASFKTNW